MQRTGIGGVGTGRKGLVVLALLSLLWGGGATQASGVAAAAASRTTAPPAPPLRDDLIAKLHRISQWDIEYSMDRTYEASASGTNHDPDLGVDVTWNFGRSTHEKYSLQMTVGGGDCAVDLRYPTFVCMVQLDQPAHLTVSADEAHYHLYKAAANPTLHPICDAAGTRDVSDDLSQSGSFTPSQLDSFGVLWIDFRTNPPRMESNALLDVPVAVHGAAKATTETCGVKSVAPRDGRNMSGRAEFCWTKDSYGYCGLSSIVGDTYVRIEGGDFIMHGSASLTTVSSECAFFFNHFPPPGESGCVAAPSTKIEHAQWVVKPHRNCEVKENVLLGPTAGTAAFDSLPDSAGDGIPDLCKMNGIRIKKGNGNVITYNLPGATAGHKDIYVEVEYMHGFATADPTRPLKPLASSLSDVVAAFAAAPVDNPDGKNGINLHAILDEEVPPIAATIFNPLAPGFGQPNDFWNLKGGNGGACQGHFGTLAERASPDCVDLLAAKRLFYRYAVFGDDQAINRGSSGVAEHYGSAGGNDFMVTLGGWSSQGITDAGGREAAEAGTFMHELGHTLGLDHGGYEAQNCKPNYLSVMNYSYQFAMANQDPNRPLDYSHGLQTNLDEASLDETKGIGGAPGHTAVFGIGGIPWSAPATGSIDWNNDGKYETVSAEIKRIDTLSPDQGHGGCSVPGWNVDGIYLSAFPFPEEFDLTKRPATSAFTVRVNQSQRPVKHVALYRNMLYFTLARPVAVGDTVSLEYTKPATDALTDIHGAHLNSWPAAPVTNRTGVRQVLHDYNDWAHLHYSFRESPGFASGVGELAHPNLPDSTADQVIATAELAVVSHPSPSPTPTTAPTPSPTPAAGVTTLAPTGGGGEGAAPSLTVALGAALTLCGGIVAQLRRRRRRI